MVFLIVMLFVCLWDVGVLFVIGSECDLNGFFSVVGVGCFVGEVVVMDVFVFNCFVILLSLFGLLNVVFFVFNFILLFFFDGGYVVVVLWEGVW